MSPPSERQLLARRALARLAVIQRDAELPRLETLRRAALEVPWDAASDDAFVAGAETLPRVFARWADDDIPWPPTVGMLAASLGVPAPWLRSMAAGSRA